MKLKSKKELLFSAILFEVIALLMIVPAIMFILKKPLEAVGGMAIFMSLLATAWNMGFNFSFQKIMKSLSIEKMTIKLRVLHAVMFEATMLTVATPIVAYILDISILHSLATNMGSAMFFTLYTFVYNIVYDKVKYTFFTSPLATNFAN